MLGGLDYRTFMSLVYRVLTALGYARSGANTDITSLAFPLIANGGQFGQSLTDGANVDWNLNNGSIAGWTLGGNRTLNNPTNVQNGGRYVLRVQQDGTGGRTITWGSLYKTMGEGTNPPQPNPAPNGLTDYYFFCSDGASLILVALPGPTLSQCRLTKSGANLLLSPLNGNILTINCKPRVIPDAGVTLAPTALAANTTYYIYAFVTGGVVLLEASATAPATQVSTGAMIKTGDNTRVLVGMARTDAGVAWADSATQRFVRSWFNDPGFAGKNTYTADRSTASGTATELNTEIRVEFLSWSGEVIIAHANGSLTNAAGTFPVTAIAFDGSTAEAGFEEATLVSSGGVIGGFGISGPKNDLAEGYHYATIVGRSDGANSATWYSNSGATGKAKTYLHVNSVRG